MDEKLAERAEAAVALGDRTGSRGKSPSNIYNVAADLLEALTLAQARIRELETFKSAVYAVAGKRPDATYGTEPSWNADLFEVERQAPQGGQRMIDEKGLDAAWHYGVAMLPDKTWAVLNAEPGDFYETLRALITAYEAARSAEPVALSGALDAAMRDALVHGAGFTVTRIAPADLAHPKEAPDV